MTPEGSGSAQLSLAPSPPAVPARPYLVETVAAQVPQCLLDALRQRLSRPLDVDDEGDAKDSPVFVIGHFHPLHELRD